MNFSLSATQGTQWSANREASSSCVELTTTCTIWSLLWRIWLVWLDPLWCNIDLMQRKERRHPAPEWWNRRFSPSHQNLHLCCHNSHFLFLFWTSQCPTCVIARVLYHMIFTFHILPPRGTYGECRNHVFYCPLVFLTANYKRRLSLDLFFWSRFVIRFVIYCFCQRFSENSC